MNQYLLDANIFIQAKNLHYGFDFCPAFWDWLIHENNNNKIFSIDKVKDELTDGNDELKDWVKKHANIFLPTDADITQHFATVSNWVMLQNFEQSATNIFFQVADFYLITHALAKNYVIVTHETPSTSPKRIKIPNVCIGLGVSFMNPYTMLRQEHARFILGANNE